MKFFGKSKEPNAPTTPTTPRRRDLLKNNHADDDVVHEASLPHTDRELHAYLRDSFKDQDGLESPIRSLAAKLSAIPLALSQLEDSGSAEAHQRAHQEMLRRKQDADSAMQAFLDKRRLNIETQIARERQLQQQHQEQHAL